MQFNLTDSAVAQIKKLADKKGYNSAVLQLTVDSGGCSGFRYIFGLQEVADNSKISIENQGATLQTDEMSEPFLEGGTLDYITELGSSYFKVINPQASANCGCGSSFGV
jgi:iron-sulfur cluster insertion protein